MTERIRWTEERVRAEASKYSTKVDFMRGSSGAYDWCKRNDMLDVLFTNQRTYWTEELIRAEAMKYTSKRSFKLGCISAYAAALRMGMGDTFFDNRTITWDEPKVRLVAKDFVSRSAFKKSFGGAYREAQRLGIIDDLFDRVQSVWTHESVRNEAAKFVSRTEFHVQSSGAYEYALKHGLLDDLGYAHTQFTFSNAYPANLYIVNTLLTDGSPAIMFGVTNKHRPNKRYNKVDTDKMSARVAYRFPTGKEARAVESSLKAHFADHHITTGLSPFDEKKGTTGEILYATAGRENIEKFIMEKHPDGCESFAW